MMHVYREPATRPSYEEAPLTVVPAAPVPARERADDDEEGEVFSFADDNGAEHFERKYGRVERDAMIAAAVLGFVGTLLVLMGR